MTMIKLYYIDVYYNKANIKINHNYNIENLRYFIIIKLLYSILLWL